jgi:hypothetical protein
MKTMQEWYDGWQKNSLHPAGKGKRGRALCAAKPSETRFIMTMKQGSSFTFSPCAAVTGRNGRYGACMADA